MKASEFAAHYKLYLWRHNQHPTHPQFNKEFSTDLSAEQFDRWTHSTKFQEFLLSEGLEPTPFLSPEQINLIDKLTDLTIPSLPLKLKAAKVTPEQYAKWKKHPYFQAVLKERTDALAVEERSAVIASLTSRASSGSVSAQKIFLEMTGDYQPRQQVDLKVTESRETIVKLVEVMQRYIPQDTLNIIILEFETLLTGITAPSQPALPARPTDVVLDIEL